MAGYLRNLGAFSQQPVSLAELADDLLRGVPTSSHRGDSPSARHPGPTGSHYGWTNPECLAPLVTYHQYRFTVPVEVPLTALTALTLAARLTIRWRHRQMR